MTGSEPCTDAHSSAESTSKNLPGAFTLVELIVTIVILAILATIAFISFGSQSSSARNSARLSDISSLNKSLELYNVKIGSYPSPDRTFTMTFSGGNVWLQGTVGDMMISKLSAGAQINKKPVDPLDSSEYIYSINSYGSHYYQIKAVFEGDSIAISDPLDDLIGAAYATEAGCSVYISGNYPGLVAKTQTGGMIYILALPSIISSTGSAGQSIEISSDSLSGYLLLNKRSLTEILPFNPNKVIFSGASLPVSDSGSLITNMMMELKNAYSSDSAISDQNHSIQNLITSSTGQLLDLGSSIISNQLSGGSVILSDIVAGDSIGNPIDGVCGTSGGQSLADASSIIGSGACSIGTPSVIAGNGPWNWTCAGNNGGTSASCSASNSVCSGTGCNSVHGNLTFSYAGTSVGWIVPGGVSTINITCRGAGGGNGSGGGGSDGDMVTLSTSSIGSLTVYVGGAGGDQYTVDPWNCPGGSGGFGYVNGSAGDDGFCDGNAYVYGAGGGGGSSAVLLGTTRLCEAKGGKGGDQVLEFYDDEYGENFGGGSGGVGGGTNSSAATIGGGAGAGMNGSVTISW